jgi:hypothetical protein
MRHVFQTDGEPPRSGSTSFAKRGSTQNSRKAAASAAIAKIAIR